MGCKAKARIQLWGCLGLLLGVVSFNWALNPKPLIGQGLGTRDLTVSLSMTRVVRSRRVWEMQQPITGPTLEAVKLPRVGGGCSTGSLWQGHSAALPSPVCMRTSCEDSSKRRVWWLRWETPSLKGAVLLLKGAVLLLVPGAVEQAVAPPGGVGRVIQTDLGRRGGISCISHSML